MSLKTEIDTDPLVRGYAGMTDQQVADDLNTAYRNKAAGHGEIFDYLMNTRAHTNQGQDTNANNTTPSIIMGRLVHVAEQVALEAALPLDPFGAGATPAEKRIINTRQLHSAKAFLEMLRSGNFLSSVLTDSEPGNIMNDLIGCGIMSAANRTDIIALSQNKQTRAEELGLGTVRVGQVAEARA